MNAALRFSRFAAIPWQRLRGRALRILRSSTFRFALLYVALLGCSVALLLTFIHWSTAGYMERQTTATIQAEIRGLAEQYRLRGLAGLSAIIAERIARDPGGSNVYLLVGGDGEPVIGNLDRLPGEPPGLDGWIDFRLREWGPNRAEDHAARGQIFLLRGGLRLLVGRDVRDLEKARSLISDAINWGLALTVALALLGSWLISSSLVRRLESINQTSREIMEGDLSRRMPLNGSGDDFDRLAANLNEMLERISDLMEGVRQVSDNIAHDLRTPLTRLRTKLELLESELPRGGAARQLADETIADTEEMLNTFNALLRIARIESGSRRASFCAVNLTALVEDVAELYEPVAAERGQSLVMGHVDSVWIDGDRDLLFQALINLVDNAIKYSPPDGRIELQVRHHGRQAQVMVADHGPGIDPELHQQVFRRFFRVDHSRSTPGSGLGLSLVRAVAQLHRAAITLADHAPGLCVTLVFEAIQPSVAAVPVGAARKALPALSNRRSKALPRDAQS